MTDSNQPLPTPPAESKRLSEFLKKTAPQEAAVSRPTALDSQVGALQDKAAELENKLHEERFAWVLTVVVIFDVAFLLHSDNWAAPVVVGVLELFGLVVFASRCRVDPIMPLLDRVAGMLPGGKNGDSK